MTRRTVLWIATAACGGAVLIGLVMFALHDRKHDRRDVVVVPPASTAPATAPAPPPPSATASTTTPTRPSQPGVATAATAPAEASLDDRLELAQREAERAQAEFRAARKAALDRLARQPDYQQAKQALAALDARLKALRQTNEQPALTNVSREWMAHKNVVTRAESQALNGEPALRGAAARVAAAVDTMTALQQQVAARDAARREQEETAARTVRAVEAAVDELAARAKANLQFLIDRGAIESLDPASGDVRVDPLVWEAITPQTREAVALAVRQSYQTEAARAGRPALPQFRIVSSRDDDAVLATYPVRMPTPPPATTRASRELGAAAAARRLR